MRKQDINKELNTLKMCGINVSVTGLDKPKQHGVNNYMIEIENIHIGFWMNSKLEVYQTLLALREFTQLQKWGIVK